MKLAPLMTNDVTMDILGYLITNKLYYLMNHL